MMIAAEFEANSTLVAAFEDGNACEEQVASELALTRANMAEHDAVATNAGAYSATFLRTSFTIFF